MVLILMSCNPPYEGAQCRSIGQQTNPSSLPLGPSAPITASALGEPASYFNYTNELACCITNPRYQGSNCGNVKCDEVIAKTTSATVNFTSDPCGTNMGNSVCTVFMQDSKIVGVYAQCRD